MPLSHSEKKEFIKILQELLEIDQVHQMTRYIQHGNTSTFTHCLIVAYLSYHYALRLSFQYDLRSVVRGAMLHDFYLYDWHVPDKSHRLHGYFHAGFALKNARKYFKLNKIEEEIIEKHMWPLNISKLPLCKEAALVCAVDKYVSMAETFYLPIIPKGYKSLERLLLKKLPAAD
ncbi:MAG TPA: HD domain-containing protein [Clostridiales bacterium]|nr:HD domain-containing protein [Clostridiales bacterium]